MIKDAKGALPRDLGAIALAIAAIGFGAAGLLFHAFPLQDRPIPAALPLRALLSVAASLAMAGAGVAILAPAARRAGAIALALLYALWILVVQLPGTLGMPTIIGMWLGPAELGVLVIAALMLGRPAMSGATATIARVLFGLCLIVFGACHFVYADITAAMVPAWLPASHFWAYATGAGHMLAGVAIACAVYARLAATMWSAMCASFVVMVHLPRVAAQPGAHAEWAMLFVALSIAASGWIMRCALAERAPVFGLLKRRDTPSPAV